MRRTLALLLAALALGLGGCFSRPDAEPPEVVPNPIATIEMEDGSKMTLELYPYIAPNTVANFVTLAQDGFYDGLIFHRVIAGFLIQGGDPAGNGTGGPGYTIRGEFAANGFENDLSHTRGVISMARAQDDYDSAGSQFFILHADAKYLDGEWAAFGRLDEASLATLDTIANTPTDAQDRPLVERKIRRITVDTRGYTYEVTKIEREE